MRILGIETSCDETSLAIVEAEGGFARPRFKVKELLISSQVKIHAPWGGVVPNLAKREHLRNLPILYKKLVNSSKFEVRNSKFEIPAIDLIAVTVGPGLEPALWTGIEFAKRLANEFKIKNSKLKIIPTNHLHGHMYSFLLPSEKKTASSKFEIRNSKFPAVGLLVSGGHTLLFSMKDLKSWRKLGETKDDAAGEAFDKVARLLDLPYPGGPHLDKLARKGDPDAIPFPRPMLNQKNFDFSFSGLKTAVLYYLRDTKLLMHSHAAKKDSMNSDTFVVLHRLKADVAASFQEAAVEVLVKKTIRAAQKTKARTILLSGGVAANHYLREKLAKESEKIGVRFIVPDFIYNGDNAAMIAAAGYFTYLKSKKYPLVAKGNLNI